TAAAVPAEEEEVPVAAVIAAVAAEVPVVAVVEAAEATKTLRQVFSNCEFQMAPRVAGPFDYLGCTAL
ncbi:MAG TPA: hypothetical protein VN774_08215, partial [Candidatus Limnocylindrales bacterium]|nr:hypothetical protein [Candidatus Limnocylindrales bacterium]